MANWYYFFQQDGKESRWTEALADRRQEITSSLRPAFSTILDLSFIPDNNEDWTKVKYRGDFYADFDAGDDLPYVCEQFKVFLGKLDAELNFDLTQAKFFASGSKGFHLEIPQECFIPKLSKEGTPYLAYVYREMAQSIIVDTLDLNVYTGKRGRQWRTTNVQRENGMYKVPLTLDEVFEIDETSYRELIKAPRPEPVSTPPFCNPKFALLFDRSKEKVVGAMRNKKKRMEKASAVLDPWKKSGKTPPTMQSLMNGENIADGAGFQSLAMQLAIYATSVGMSRQAFLDNCHGLCENHVSDSRRYNTVGKRREELGRMYDYMEQDVLYDFDVGPIVRLLKPGTSVHDLGVLDREDHEDMPDAEEAPVSNDAPIDIMRGLRKGFFMNGDGMFKRVGDKDEPISRAVLRNVEAFIDVESKNFSGYEFDVVVDSKVVARKMLGADTFSSANNMRKFFGGLQVSYQGGEQETSALLDIMAEKAKRGGRVYSYPREGFFIIDHPEKIDPTPVAVYLTQDTFESSIDPSDPDYFRLRYRPGDAVSTYLIDIHKAPDLTRDMLPAVEDLFNFNCPEVVINSVGWFIAAHYRSAYLRLFEQFPNLQVFGEAGAGKSQSVIMLSRLHWYRNSHGLATATSYTPFAIDNKVSSSHSAPAIFDEYKPRELRSQRGKYEKMKDVLKNSYIGGDTGNRGTINRGGETSLGIIKSKCAAPLIFIGEAIENETAIVERCVLVKVTKDYQTEERRQAFLRLHDTDEGKRALSAIGKLVMRRGFGIDLKEMYMEVSYIVAAIKAKIPAEVMNSSHVRSMAERIIFNTAVVIHGWLMLKEALATVFGDHFNARIEDLISEKYDRAAVGEDAKAVKVFGRSEITKMISQIALLSREQDRAYEMRHGKDYLNGDGWVEVKIERAYSNYRQYCAATHEQALFDNLEAFMVALTAYSPVMDSLCATSDLRGDGSTETIMRFDVEKLARDGVQQFKS